MLIYLTKKHLSKQLVTKINNFCRVKEERKQLDVRTWAMDTEGLCLSVSVEEKEDVNKLNLLIKQSNLQLRQRLA